MRRGKICEMQRFAHGGHPDPLIPGIPCLVPFSPLWGRLQQWDHPPPKKGGNWGTVDRFGKKQKSAQILTLPGRLEDPFFVFVFVC